MATYYADFVNGNDANDGLSPDASSGGSKPWKTIAKCLGATGIASGDTVYLSPAGPFREVVTVAMVSAVAETSVLGDPANAQGFKTSGGVLIAPAEVIFTAYTTDDTTAPSASVLLDLAQRDFLTFQFLTFVQGTNTTLQNTTATSTNITVRDCVFLAQQATGSIFQIDLTIGADVAANVLIERCVFFSSRSEGGSHIRFTAATSASADYDMACTVRNCLFVGKIGRAHV